MTKTEHVIGAMLAAAVLAVAAFAAGRMSTKSWPVVGSLEHACSEYIAARAAFVQGEREFERQRSPYRYPMHAAVFRSFERPDAYLARVSTAANHAAFVQRRDDCVRHLAGVRR